MPAPTASAPEDHAKSDRQGRPRRVWTLHPRPTRAVIVTVVILLAAFFAGFHYADPAPLSLALGLPLLAFGVLIRIVTNSVLRKNQEVCRDGLYAISRHPMYVGSLALATGIAVILNNALGLALIAAMIGIATWRIWKEEAFLLANLPGYGEYRREVPAFPTPGSLSRAFRRGRLRQHLSLEQCYLNGEVFRLNLYALLLPASGLYLRYLGKLELADGALIAAAVLTLCITALSAYRHPATSPRSRLDYLVPAVLGAAVLALAASPA